MNTFENVANLILVIALMFSGVMMWQSDTQGWVTFWSILFAASSSTLIMHFASKASSDRTDEKQA